MKHSLEKGLTKKEVLNRIQNHQSNEEQVEATKTIPRIIFDNTFTLFNILNFVLAFFVFLTGSYKNLLFLGVVICNTCISTFQEIRSKKVVDKLSLLATSKATVKRDGEKKEISLSEIVVDDIIYYELGNQVVVDSVVLDGDCEVNEAFITGETEPIHKIKGDLILSGSFLVSGSCTCYVKHVGSENYTSKISKGARIIKKTDSEMMKSLKQLIKIISICIIPLGLLLFYRQLQITNFDYKESVIPTVAALIGMIPEGLILLTSTVLAVSIVRLSKYKVLVQDLYCIEALAHVDTLCLDKTGTITEGSMEVEKIVPKKSSKEMKEYLQIFLHHVPSKNATYEALKKEFGTKKEYEAETVYPFSSDRKWSAVTLKEKGTYFLGAPERLLKKEDLKELESIETHYRVLAFCHSKKKLEGKMLPKDMELIGFVLLSDKIRPTAKATLAFFKKQGVEIKFISGDSVSTVTSIAETVGIKGKGIDMTDVKKKDLEKIVEEYTIFGRVDPESKRDLILELKKKGHKVAMTGDGVNDVLALKEADCSIAMNSGTDAARNVSELVLLDSNFDALPKVLEEGRRTIHNIERSAAFFLVKTIYASILAVFFAIFPYPYPFLPIQMSLTSMFTIGIPSFILALEPNKTIVKGSFLKNVLKRSLPTALAITFHIILISIIGPKLYLTDIEISTLCVFSAAYLAFLLLFRTCVPFNLLKKLLCGFLVIGYILAFVFLKEFYSLSPIDLSLFLWMFVISFLGLLLFQLNYKIYELFFNEKK